MCSTGSLSGNVASTATFYACTRWSSNERIALNLTWAKQRQTILAQYLTEYYRTVFVFISTCNGCVRRVRLIPCYCHDEKIFCLVPSNFSQWKVIWHLSLSKFIFSFFKVALFPCLDSENIVLVTRRTRICNFRCLFQDWWKKESLNALPGLDESFFWQLGVLKLFCGAEKKLFDRICKLSEPKIVQIQTWTLFTRYAFQKKLIYSKKKKPQWNETL